MTDSTNRFCTACGASMPPESKFCPSCGKQGAASPTETPSSERKPADGKGLDKELFRSWVGGLMIFGGLIAAAYFFFIFNTAVDVPIREIFGESVGGLRVNNLGLMSQRQNGIIFSFGAAIVGAAIELFARLRK